MGDFTWVKSPMNFHGGFYPSGNTLDYKMTHWLFTLFQIISVYLYFFPGLPKRQNLKFCIYFFFLSNIHNMFRHCALITWYLTKNWQKYWQKHAKDHKTSTLYFHFLRQLARESESRAQRGSGKNFHPSGVSPFSLWPTLPLLPRPQAPPCWVWWLLQWHEVRPRARTPPTTWD